MSKQAKVGKISELLVKSICEQLGLKSNLV